MKPHDHMKSYPYVWMSVGHKNPSEVWCCGSLVSAEKRAELHLLVYYSLAVQYYPAKSNSEFTNMGNQQINVSNEAVTSVDINKTQTAK